MILPDGYQQEGELTPISMGTGCTFAGPAPYFPATEGEFLIGVRQAADPIAVAARPGLEVDDVYEFIATVATRLSPADIERVRLDPDVTVIEQNRRADLT
ncbi:hypothetical protein [Actinomadura sp. 7K534]|uniref:hypothetical protein n=1 Tax=Actinomadura sp. 7K534 TaxID=2530366 RepID=UPI0010436146|nr:hypothetical protein [Actinomadura sp. 7K534]TDB92394.1 hypothetical protein E1266_24400 [Actinomadura sp. 7K534]